MTLRRNNRRGYDVEVMALRLLKPIFPRLRRRGSVARRKNDPDLEQDGEGTLVAPVKIVAHKDLGRRNPLLVTLSAEDFVALVQTPRILFGPVYIQAKGYQRTLIGTWYAGLRDRVKEMTRG